VETFISYFHKLSKPAGKIDSRSDLTHVEPDRKKNTAHANMRHDDYDPRSIAYTLSLVDVMIRNTFHSKFYHSNLDIA
jgi:hypothetical protein